MTLQLRIFLGIMITLITIITLSILGYSKLLLLIGGLIIIIIVSIIFISALWKLSGEIAYDITKNKS